MQNHLEGLLVLIVFNQFRLCSLEVGYFMRVKMVCALVEGGYREPTAIDMRCMMYGRTEGIEKETVDQWYQGPSVWRLQSCG